VDTIDVREFPSVIDIVVRQAEIEIGDKGDKTCIACKGSGFLKAFRRDKEKLRRMVFRCTYCKTSEKYTKVLPWADVYGLSGVNLEKGGDDDEISVKNEN